MSYTLYKPIYDDNGRYIHLEYWTGAEFTLNPRCARQYPSPDSCERAIVALKQKHGLLYRHPSHYLDPLDSAYRSLDRDRHRDRATPAHFEIPVRR